MSNGLALWTTFGIGGQAREISVASTRSQLVDCEGLVLGRGSKILVSDGGYDGAVVINRFDAVRTDDRVCVAGSGLALPKLARILARAGLSGMEWAEGIPGSVGGAVRMNAGAFGKAVSDVLLYCDVRRRGLVVRLAAAELGFGYRHSALDEDDIVIEAAFLLERDRPDAIAERCREYARLRSLKQPSGRSAGSVFKNPPGLSAGKLIEQAGLKGLRRGGAVISPKHGNFILNVGGATAKDVKELISLVKAEIGVRGVELNEEIIYIGDF